MKETRFKKVLSPNVVYKTALGVSFVLVISIAIVFHLQMKNLNSSVKLITNSNKKQFELEKIISAISQEENNIRNFIISKDSSFLEENDQLKKDVEHSLTHIKSLITEDTDISEIKKVENLVNRKNVLIEDTFKESLAIPRDTFLLNLKLRESATTKKELRKKIYQLMNEENVKLKIYNINHHYDIEISSITAFSLTIIVLVVLLFSLSKVNDDFQKTKTLNEELRITNQIAENAERVAGICHWKINLQTGKYFYSDNLYRILGKKPHEFEENLENFTQFIHPDDLEYAVTEHNNSLENITPTSLIYRIIRPDGEIRYVHSIGDFVYNDKGQLVKIGVINDITDHQNSQVALKEKNDKLISINAELESFNQIVSHDLQEPLRKIQMFISRIEGEPSGVTSPKGKDYFEKIKISANRMQNLMIDLVEYSRTIKDHKIFDKVSLDDLLIQIIQDLSINIEEKNAVINLGKLPKINIIQFQIKQLFINLITNSLKYSKNDVAPIINIYSEKIITPEKIGDIVLTDKKYYKIIVSDNGIGFKQEFSERIFVLFKRLETESSYHGTGLGLAICKKIMENHNGFIKADGVPNEGAVFAIYFPK